MAANAIHSQACEQRWASNGFLSGISIDSSSVSSNGIPKIACYCLLPPNVSRVHQYDWPYLLLTRAPSRLPKRPVEPIGRMSEVERGRVNSLGALERGRLSSAGALERKRVGSSESKFRGRARSPNPRSHPFQRGPGFGGDPLNRDRAQTFDSIRTLSQYRGQGRASGSVGGGVGGLGSALSRARANTFDPHYQLQTYTKTVDHRRSNSTDLHPGDFRPRSLSNPTSGAFAQIQAQANSSMSVSSVSDATIETFNSPTADADLDQLFSVLDVRGGSSLNTPLRNRALPASFFEQNTQGKFNPTTTRFSSVGGTHDIATQQVHQPNVSIKIDQDMDMHMGTLSEIDEIFAATSRNASAFSQAQPQAQPSMLAASSVTLSNPPVIQQSRQQQNPTNSEPALDILDILDSGLLQNEFQTVRATPPLQMSASGVHTSAVSSDSVSAVDVDILLDDLDLDF